MRLTLQFQVGQGLLLHMQQEGEAVLTTDPNFSTMMENDATLGFYE